MSKAMPADTLFTNPIDSNESSDDDSLPDVITATANVRSAKRPAEAPLSLPNSPQPARNTAAKSRNGTTKAAAAKAKTSNVPKKTNQADSAASATGKANQRVRKRKKPAADRSPAPPGGSNSSEAGDEATLEDCVPETAFIDIIIPRPPPTARSKAVKKETSERRGPFSYSLSDNFDAFKDALATELHMNSHQLGIAAPQLKWRYNIPANSLSLPLHNDAGYTALINSVRAKKNEKKINPDKRLIVVSLPKPVPVANPMPWTDDITGSELASSAEFLAPAGDDYMEDTGFSQKRVTMEAELAPRIESLRKRYPVGVCGQHPRIRCAQDASGNHFDMSEKNELRLKSMATQMTLNDVEHGDLPNTSWFGKEYAIRAPKKTANPPSPAPASVPATAPHVVTSSNNELASLTAQANQLQLFALSQLLGHSHGIISHHPQPIPPTLPDIPVQVSPSFRQNLTLDQYVARYDISDSTRTMLEKLQFSPGDCLDAVSGQEWKEVGFMTLSWNRLVKIDRLYQQEKGDGTLAALLPC